MTELKIYGIGVDLVEVKRITAAIKKNPGFIKKVYTDSEARYCTERIKSCFINYAERFAAKEAISKALKTGIGKDIRFNEIEIVNLHSGEPVVNLHGKTRVYCDKLAIKDIKITLSGTGGYAIAFAIAFI